MTRRRVLTLLSIPCAMALLTIALTAPVRLEGAALVPPKASRPAAIHGIEVHLGDGIFQLRLRTCEGCAPALTFEIRLPQIHIDWFLPS